MAFNKPLSILMMIPSYLRTSKFVVGCPWFVEKNQSDNYHVINLPDLSLFNTLDVIIDVFNPLNFVIE